MVKYPTTWDQAVKKALTIYNNRDQYTYCLGSQGEDVSDPHIKELYNYYYNNGYREKMGMTYEEWKVQNAGKKCFDCSGFLNHCYGLPRSNSSWSYGEMPKQRDLVAGVAASALWMKGHVGIDIGYGFFVHFPNWNRSCEFGKVLEYPWTSSHLVSNVDYDGANNR